MLYSRSLLVIYFIYSSVYMSTPVFQFIPPPPPPIPPGNHKYFLHLYLYFCFVDKFICSLFLDSTYKQYHMIFVFLCLPSLSMTISRSSHVAADMPLHSCSRLLVSGTSSFKTYIHKFIFFSYQKIILRDSSLTLYWISEES